MKFEISALLSLGAGILFFIFSRISSYETAFNVLTLAFLGLGIGLTVGIYALDRPHQE